VSGRPVRTAHVANSAATDQIVEGFEGLLHRGVVVPAVDLIQVDVPGIQSFETVLAGFEDMFSPQAHVVDIARSLGGFLAHGAPDFGGDDDVLSVGVGLTQGVPQDFLGFTVGVDVGGVEKIYPGVQRRLDHVVGQGLTDFPDVVELRSERHCSETEFGDFQTRVAQAVVLHAVPSGRIRVRFVENVGWSSDPQFLIERRVLSVEQIGIVSTVWDCSSRFKRQRRLTFGGSSMAGGA